MKYLIICIILSVLSCSNNYYKIIGQDIKEISLEYFNEATFSNKLSLNLTLKDNTYYYGDTLLFNLNFVNTSNENIKVIPKSIISLISCDSITYLPGLQIPINTTIDLNTIIVLKPTERYSLPLRLGDYGNKIKKMDNFCMKLLYTNRIIEYKHEIIEIGKFTTNNKIIRFIH